MRSQGPPAQGGGAGRVASGAGQTADQIAWSTSQLAAIGADPQFRGGNYYDAADGEGPHVGLGIARMIAHTTYRSESELAERFGRSYQGEGDPLGRGGLFSVQSYLQHHGRKLARRFDANTYLLMTKALDYFDPARDYHDNLSSAFEKTRCAFLVISFTSDWRFPSERSREIVDALVKARRNVSYVEVNSTLGHDDFLMPIPDYQHCLANYLRRIASERKP